MKPAILSFFNKSKFMFKGLLYFLFVLIFVNLIVSANDTLTRILFSVVMILVLAFNILFDFLKHLYFLMQKALIVDCDFAEVEKNRNRLVHFDVLKGMKTSLILFDTLYLIDQNKPEEVFALLDKEQRFFSGHLDYLFIRYHSLFKCYTLINNKNQAKKAYHELNKLRDVSLRRANKQMNLLYNWKQIDGLLNYVEKDYKKAFSAYIACSTANMNSRELTHYYYEFALVCHKANNKKQFRNCLDTLIEINPSSPYTRELGLL